MVISIVIIIIIIIIVIPIVIINSISAALAASLGCSGEKPAACLRERTHQQIIEVQDQVDHHDGYMMLTMAIMMLMIVRNS